MTTIPDIARLVNAEKRRTKRRAYLRRLVVAMTTNWLMALIDGWLLMLGVAVAHSHWVPDLPTIGYWWSVLLVALLRGVFSNRTSKKDGE